MTTNLAECVRHIARRAFNGPGDERGDLVIELAESVESLEKAYAAKEGQLQELGRARDEAARERDEYKERLRQAESVLASGCACVADAAHETTIAELRAKLEAAMSSESAAKWVLNQERDAWQASAAAMREALSTLKRRCEDWDAAEATDIEAAEKALATDAGRTLLVERDSLRKIAEAADALLKDQRTYYRCMKCGGFTADCPEESQCSRAGCDGLVVDTSCPNHKCETNAGPWGDAHGANFRGWTCRQCKKVEALRAALAALAAGKEKP